MKRILLYLCLFFASFASSLPLAHAEPNHDALTPRAHDVQLSDVRTHYVVAGHGPLVFMSSVGWGPGSLEYQNAFKPMESHFTMVYVDERGNGASSLPADVKQMSVVVMADDIEYLRQYLGLDTMRLMEHSA